MGLPGDFKPGDVVYFTGESEETRYFDPDEAYMYGPDIDPQKDGWKYGEEGEVTGPCLFKPDSGVLVRFPDNKGPIRCFIKDLSREPPPPKAGCSCAVQ